MDTDEHRWEKQDIQTFSAATLSRLLLLIKATKIAEAAKSAEAAEKEK